MARKKINAVNIEQQLYKSFEDMVADCEDEIKKQVEPVIEKCAKDYAFNKLKPATPVSKRKYQENDGHLKDKINIRTEEVNGIKRFIVNFGDKAWLTPILEYGITHKGGKFSKHPFIQPTFDANKEQYYNDIRLAVEKVVRK